MLGKPHKECLPNLCNDPAESRNTVGPALFNFQKTPIRWADSFRPSPEALPKSSPDNLSSSPTSTGQNVGALVLHIRVKKWSLVDGEEARRLKKEGIEST